MKPETTPIRSGLSRRGFLVAGAASMLPAARAFGAGSSTAGKATKLLTPIFEQIACKWSRENPRNDHQLIFPLSEDRLMLVWCEYYATRPSQVVGTKAVKAGDSMPCRISARISTDRCRSWGERIILQQNLWVKNVKHPNLVRLPSGEVLFFFVGWDNNSQRNVFMKRSGNNCESWGKIARISKPGWYCNNHGRAVQLESGRILLPAHAAFENGRLGGPYKRGNLRSFVYYSDDGFKTWQQSEDTMTAPGRGAHEPSIVELGDGRLFCILRTTTGQLYQAYSEDQGVHWSKPQPSGLPSPDSEPKVARIPNTKHLLLLWNNVSSHGNHPRIPLTAAISKDEGRTWGNFQDIDATPDTSAAYPDVFFQGDEAVVTYYSGRKAYGRGSEVMLKIFKTEQFYG